MDGGSIGRDSGAVRYPASLAQTRFWLLDALDPGNPALNVAVRWTLLGAVTAEQAESAWQQVIARHEVLRTALLTVDGMPEQAVYPKLPFRLRHYDLSKLPDHERMAEADRLGEVEATTPFILEAAPLMRATMINLEPGSARILLTLHHTVCDGWSIGIVANEFTAALAGVALPTLALQYGDYAEWQQAWLASPALTEAKSYWLRQLANLPYAAVPPDHPSDMRGAGAIASVMLARSITDEMARLAVEHGCTLFTVALAALGRMLQVRIVADDIAVGTQVANRGDVELEPLIGCFINTLVLRLNPARVHSWSESINHAASVVADALQHGEVPFELLIQALNPKRDRGRTPLFSINFIFQRSFVSPPKYAGVTLVDMPSHSAGALYDLNFFMVERPEGWRASCEYDTARYESATVEAMLTEWVAALQGQPIRVIESPLENRLGELWREVLGVQSSSPDDDFFEVGGHSLLAARLLSRIEAAFAKRITMAELFSEPTLAGLARRLTSLMTDASSTVVLNASGRCTPIIAFGAAARWQALSAALGSRFPFACLTSRPSDAIKKLYPQGKLALLAGESDGVEAIGLAEALRRQGREVVLVLMEASAPTRSGWLSRLRKPSSVDRFYGPVLLFCKPEQQDDFAGWKAHLLGAVETVPLTPSRGDAAVAHRIASALS